MTYLSERQIKQLLDDYLAKEDLKPQEIINKKANQSQIANKKQGNKVNSLLARSSL